MRVAFCAQRLWTALLRGKKMVAISVLSCVLYAGPSHSDTYEYDALGRLTAVIYDNNTVQLFTYDPAGNRTQVITSLSGNFPPEAFGDHSSVQVGCQLDVFPLANDTDRNTGDVLTIASITTPTYGTAVISPDSMSISYTASPTNEVTDVFYYTVTDPSGATDEGQISLTTATAKSMVSIGGVPVFLIVPMPGAPCP